MGGTAFRLGFTRVDRQCAILDVRILECCLVVVVLVCFVGLWTSWIAACQVGSNGQFDSCTR